MIWDGKRRKGTRGGLFLIGIVLASSGMLRLFGETGSAIAREVEAIAGSSASEALDPQMVKSCQPDQDIAETLQVLGDRSRELDLKEAELTTRLQTLKLAEAEIEQNLAALIEAEEALEATMALAESAAETDIDRLTEVYQKMKPKDAADLFETMDPNFSAGFLARMRPDAAAAVLAGLTPETAYTVSIVLAGRNANAPTE